MPEPVYIDAVVEGAQLILAKLNEVYTETGVAIPTRQFLAIGGLGQTVHSQEQVTVSWEQAYSGLPQNQAQFPVKRHVPWTGVFVVEVVRSLPGMTGRGAEPSPETMSATAIQQMHDVALMTEAAKRSFESSWEGSGTVEINAGMPSGLLQAVTMTVAISI